MIECNSLPVSHVRLDSVHKCTQSGPDKFVGASWCNCWAWCFHETLKSSVCMIMVLILSLVSDFGSLDATNASKFLFDQLEERILPSKH